MSDGGTVMLYSTNNDKLRNDEEYINPALLNLEHSGSTLNGAEQTVPSEPIMIDEPDGVDQEHLIATYPNISWVAYSSELCEEHYTVTIYLSPMHSQGLSYKPGVYTLRHVEYDTVIRTDNREEDEKAYAVFKHVMELAEN